MAMVTAITVCPLSSLPNFFLRPEIPSHKKDLPPYHGCNKGVIDLGDEADVWGDRPSVFFPFPNPSLYGEGKAHTTSPEYQPIFNLAKLLSVS